MRVATLLLVLVSACSTDSAQTTDRAEEKQIAEIAESFVTAFDTTDNIDSPAIYHGANDQHWVIATAKATDVLVVYDATSGRELRRVGRSGSGNGEFRRPNGVLVVDDSLLLVVERDNRRVQAFTLPAFESLGTFGGEVLRNPYGIAAVRDEQGSLRVYVTDNYETAEGEVPPLDQLGERVKWFRVSRDSAGIRAVHSGSFGDTTAEGAIRITESIVADPVSDRMLIAEELEIDSHIKVYSRDGRYIESFGRGYFPQQAEGIALYACGNSGGYWLGTDQGPVTNTFHLFDRATFAHVASFRAARTHTTDGIVLTQRAFGSFSAGAMYMAHGDAAVSALDWAKIATATGVRGDCASN